MPAILEMKMALLGVAIEVEMAKLGLMRVSGPDTSEWTGALQPSVEPVNHQWRGTYLFAVADRDRGAV